jgi:hypothetical protein
MEKVAYCDLMAKELTKMAKDLLSASPKVERTKPGSKNKYKVTYPNGTVKYTDDKPDEKSKGDGKEKSTPSPSKKMNAIGEAMSRGGVKADTEQGEKLSAQMAKESVAQMGAKGAEKYLQSQADKASKESDEAEKKGQRTKADRLLNKHYLYENAISEIGRFQ